MNSSNQKQKQDSRKQQINNQLYQPNYQNSWIQYQNYPPYQYYQYPSYQQFYYHQITPQVMNRQRQIQKVNPVDPRKRNKPFIVDNSQIKKQVMEESDHDFSSQQQSQDQEQMYIKNTRQIAKKRDPILDSPEQIKKWIEARKKNYPSTKRSQSSKIMNSEMSLLEKKIRQKLLFVSSDGKGLLKKLKNMDILKRIITNPHIQNKKNKKIRKIKKQKEGKTYITKKQDKQSSSDNQSPIQKPINKKQQKSDTIMTEQKQKIAKVSGLQPQQMIKHLQQKQAEDRQFYSKLMDYKSNSLNYKYATQTLETNFILQEVFQESSYLLQAIRFIAKNNFFQN